MDDDSQQFDHGLPLAPMRPFPQVTVADQVFDELHASILSLRLPPLTKISEIEVAKKMGVSRQPVREAFKRLAKLGFLVIRPQSSTLVSLISEAAVLRARFIREALELQTCRVACDKIDDEGKAVLAATIEQQRSAVAAQDRQLFHALDDRFHREICELAGVGYVWDLIHESKGHMDRIRMLSLTTASQETALKEHIAILEAISAGCPDKVATCMSQHLGRIVTLIDEMKAENHTWFETGL